MISTYIKEKLEGLPDKDKVSVLYALLDKIAHNQYKRENLYLDIIDIWEASYNCVADKFLDKMSTTAKEKLCWNHDRIIATYNELADAEMEWDLEVDSLAEEMKGNAGAEKIAKARKQVRLK